MNRLARLVTVVATLSLPLLLSDCSSFDPTDIMDNMFASQKKPLAGDRKPLFPSGTPGVTQGLPAELVKGYQPPPPQTDATQDAQAAVPEKPKPKPKPKPKVVAAPPTNQSSQPAAMSAPAPATTRPVAASPGPDTPPTRQTAAPTTGGSIWPDPPAPTVTR
jgi:hypothetical protein